MNKMTLAEAKEASKLKVLMADRIIDGNDEYVPLQNSYTGEIYFMKKEVRQFTKDINRVREKLGKYPTVGEYREHGRYPATRVCNEFGKWSEALRASGCDTAGRRGIKVTREQMIEDGNRLGRKLGHAPNSAEYHEEGKHTASTILNEFSTWSEFQNELDYDPKEPFDVTVPVRELGECTVREIIEHTDMSRNRVYEAVNTAIRDGRLTVVDGEMKPGPGPVVVKVSD